MDQLSLMTSDETIEDEGQGGLSLLSTLLNDSRLYKTGKEYAELVDFVGRMKEFAPFNAMLLQIQKPGLSYAATPKDWKLRFNRTIKLGVRPLLIMWPFSPVALVYDVIDTVGDDIPEGALNTFIAYGNISQHKIDQLVTLLSKKRIKTAFLDEGDSRAGSISVASQEIEEGKVKKEYLMCINNNHQRPTQFVTILHELGHLFLGHLGKDDRLKIEARIGLSHSQKEMEAESVAYVLSKRYGVDSNSAAYLSNHIENFERNNNLDIYKVMTTAGKIETLLNNVLRYK